MIHKLVPKPYKKSYKKLYLKTFYNLLTLYQFNNRYGDFRFMNYGYAETDTKNQVHTAADIQKLQSALYLHLFKHAPLNGKDIIEIGCGRGGGCWLLYQQYNPGRVVGTDFSSMNIKKCNRNFKAQNLTFMQGDAEKQQFPDSVFDVVINLESSHCYPSMQNFLKNVYAILRPGGTFLYADIFRSESKIAETENLLKATGLKLEKKEDISPNIVLSLELFAAKRDEMLQSSRLLRWFKIDEKFAASDSRNFSKLKSGEKKYLFYVLKK